MSDSASKSFVEKARELLAQEDASQAKQAAAQETAERRRERLIAEGPAVYQQLTAELVQQVKSQVQEVGRLFSLPTHPQKGAEIEIVVRDKWLLTVKLVGLGLYIDVYELAAQNNPRMRDRSDSQDHSQYKLELTDKEEWQWKHTSSSSPRVRATVFTPGSHAPYNLTNQALISHVLEKTLALAQEEKARSSGGFIIP